MKKRLNTIDDIKYCLTAPLFKDKYKVYYEKEKDVMLVTVNNPDHLKLLYGYAVIEDSHFPHKIQKDVQIPENRFVFLKGPSIELFADSLIETLIHVAAVTNPKLLNNRV